MKRDKELIRKLLINVRDEEEIMDVDNKTLYHLNLLHDASLIKEYDRGLALTWKGQEAIDLIGSDEAWKLVNGFGFIDAPFEVIFEYIKKKGME